MMEMQRVLTSQEVVELCPEPTRTELLVWALDALPADPGVVGRAVRQITLMTEGTVDIVVDTFGASGEYMGLREERCSVASPPPWWPT